MSLKCYSQYQKKMALFEKTALRLAFFQKLAQIGSF
jgi:hypothetical protein